MFGYVTASLRELDKETKNRYGAVYCGICRQIRDRAGQVARLSLSYDMAFLALLLMSLYEPEEIGGKGACMLHPRRQWLDGKFIRYGADMNIALAYYNSVDDYEDEGKLTAKAMAGVLEKELPRIRQAYPRQCAAMEQSLGQLSKLEKENCSDPDALAACFGSLLGELFVYEEDMWADCLRRMGAALGRYIYLADAATDYRRDKRKGQYNPFLAAGMQEDWQLWEQYLVLAMGRCTDYYERLPLVQDKKLLDNILYSGVWLEFRRRQGRKGEPGRYE